MGLQTTAAPPPFDDATAIAKGSSDPTKQLRFEVDGFTAGQTRVATFPDANITVARTDAAQTFTGLQTVGSLRIGNSNGDLALSGTSLHYGETAGTTTHLFKNGAISTSPTTATQLTGNQNDYNPGTQNGFLRLSSDASRTVTGLTFTTTQIDGEHILVVNVGSNNIVLANESASSTAANRFTNSTGADVTLSANQAADLIYDGTSSRWRVFKRN